MSDSILKTPLYDWHVELGGRMVDFAGWSMPVQYASIVDEHVATRSAATVFDVSHMGRLRIEGHDAGGFSTAWSRGASTICLLVESAIR